MHTKLITLFTRTPLHVGAGNSVGVVDSPVMRERHTKTPIIPGSSLKGVLADLWNDDENLDGKKRKKDSALQRLFGSDDDANAFSGSLLIGEARVLAFPLRSAKGAFAWITCPHALKKFKRDAGASFELDAEFDKITEEKCLAGTEVVFKNNSVVLEEYKFERAGEIPKQLAEALKTLVPDDTVWNPQERLVIVSDEIFSYFVENACEIVTRIRIDDKTGTVAGGALFNQEQIPSETLFYALVGSAKKTATDDLNALEEKIKQSESIIQVGGDATIGLGFCSVNFR